MRDLREALSGRIEYRLDTADNTLERFAHELQTDAAHAFQWADTAVAAAAEKAVWQEIAVEMNAGRDVSTISTSVVGKAMTEAASTSRCTSATATLFQRAKVIAWSQAAIELSQLCNNA